MLSAFGRGSELPVSLDPALTVHGKYFEKHAAQLKHAAEAAVFRYREKVVEHQFVLERLANMAIELYARAATISRTQSLIDRQGARAAAHEIELCGLFSVESGRRFRANREALDSKEDAIDARRRRIATAVRAAGGSPAKDPVLEE
jgi:hypothetical protein